MIAAMSARQNLIGRSFGDFVVKEHLGEGGAGDVYLVEQLALGRQAVLKVTKHSTDPDSVSRFMREARLASRLDHPFVAHVYGFGSEADGTLWIAMELVRGTPLDKLIKEQGAIPLVRFVPFFARVCEVLFAAHEQGIVHRDIKPHNLMVIYRAGQMLPKLLDLGIARSGGHEDKVKTPSSESVLPELSTRLLEAETLNITRHGKIVGTPHYMSPEQWRDASSATNRSDLYSLAILAYQALTGALPFASSKTIFALAVAHAKEALPPLPPGLPLALHEVLSRGAAKAPADRYATALEFSDALHEASGIGGEPLALPTLDRTVLDTVVIDAPQPIAEAAALVDAARSPRQQLEALIIARRVVVRYLAVVALAGRARVGPGSSADSPAVTALFEKLALDRLEDTEWLALVQQLVQPFALRSTAHPVPELVTFFFSEDARETAEGDAALRALNACVWPAVTGSDETLVHALRALVPAFSTVLQKLSFICDYALVVRHEETERWMGTRRIRRTVQNLASAPPLAGVPVLVDRTDLAVLTLSPLMQVFAPSGGMPEEIFFLDGAGRHGARLIALPATFERQSEDVWAWFSANLVDVSRARAGQEGAEKPPYKGLGTFTANDADNYFGREREAEEFANRLRTQNLLVVVGPSGVGKSSFILAGVLPVLARGWRAVVARPGANPFVALAARLESAGLPNTLGDTLQAALAPHESLLIVIDQFEELVTLCQDSATRVAFAQALVDAAAHASGRIRVVLTLRDDFLIKVQQIAPLTRRLSSSLQLLATPAQDDLLRVVTEPARRVGYAFDDADLPRRMVEAVAEYPGALALLSFTAQQLWELRDRQLRQMRKKTYEALGGVGGALAHHAEVTLAAMSSEETPLVREAFRQLVTAQGTRAVLSLSELLDILGGSAAARSLVEKLVVARLLVTSEGVDGADRIEIIHEALIVAWPRLVAWQREDAETARLRDSLRASARQWEERGRPRGLLWRAETLTEYKVWRARYPGRLTQSEEAFAGASVRDERRGRRIRQALTVTAMVVLSVALVVIFRAYREANQRFLALREEQGRLALIDSKPMQALAYLDEAARGGADNENMRIMASTVAFELEGDKGIAFEHQGGIDRFAVSTDATMLATFALDGTIGLMSIGDSTTRAMITSPAVCHMGVFTEEGKSVAAGCEDGKVRLIDLATRKIVSTFSVAEGFVSGLSLGTDSHSLFVAVGFAGVFRIELANGQVTRLLASEQAPSLMIERGSSGHTAVIFAGTGPFLPGSMRGFVLARDGKLTTVALGEGVLAVAFSKDERELALGLSDGSVGLFDLQRREWLWHKPAHTGRLFSIQFAPQGRGILSSASDSLVMWQSSGERAWLFAHPAIPNVCFSPDGLRVFAGGGDPALHVIDTRTGDLLWRHFGHRDAILQCLVTREGDTVISTALDGLVRRWDARMRADEPIVGVDKVRDIGAMLSPNTAAVASDDGLTWVDGGGHAAQILSEKIPADAAAGAALSENGRAALLSGQRVRTFAVDTAKVLTDTTFAGRAEGLAISPRGGHTALQMAQTGTILVGPSPLVTLRAEGDFLALGGFVDEQTIVTCSHSGKLRVWQSDGQLRSELVAHATNCYADVTSTGEVRSFADDGSIKTWEPVAGHLQPRHSLETHLPLVYPGRGWPPPFLSQGDWVRVAGDGLELARVPLRAQGFKFYSANDGALYYSDSRGAAAKIAEPPQTSLEALKHLQRCRGIWGLETGHLRTRRESECGAR